MIEQATQWILANTVPGQGIIIHSRNRLPYPEVSGYYIPTLLSIGHAALARQYAEWLMTCQQPDGSFGGASGQGSYVFDTGQIIRGWVTLVDQMPEIVTPLRRACDWLIASADASTGRLLVPPPGNDWSMGARGEVNEGIHLYALAPLAAVAQKLDDARYRKFAQKSLRYYLKHVPLSDFTRRNSLSHFFGYIQDALLDLGEVELARKGMASLEPYQQSNGGVPAYSDVTWVCSTGLAQLALIWYRLGQSDRANAALDFMRTLQNPSGGFMGSYGMQADYFPTAEISWAVKYYIDATHCRIAQHFDDTVGHYQNSIPETDGRARAILEDLGDLDGKRVLDAGCGKGRYAALLQRRHPGAHLTALDISEKMLSHVPAGITRVKSGLLQIPAADASYDAIICIEALEHAMEIERALAELCRVLAPGGTLVIIDKNREHLGRLDMPGWEKWFAAGEVAAELEKHGLQVQSRYVAYDHHAEPNGLFLCWTGRKAPVAAPVELLAAV